MPVLAILTAPTREEADALARGAVEARLAACAQVAGPIGSVYRWQGEVETAEEWRVELKTSAKAADALVAHLVERHSYDVPEVVLLPVAGGNPAYLSWVTAETG